MEAVQTVTSTGAPDTRGTRKDPKAQATIKKYKHEWRNPPDEDSPAEYKIEGPNEN